MDGVNGTIMCYGQTGSGKTFTMSGACSLSHTLPSPLRFFLFSPAPRSTTTCRPSFLTKKKNEMTGVWMDLDTCVALLVLC